MPLSLGRRAVRRLTPALSPVCFSLVALLGLQPPAPHLPALDAPRRPDASSTGVPVGTVLRPSGPLVLTEDSTVIEGLDVQGCVEVKAHRVTIRRTRIRCPEPYGIRIRRGFWGTRVEDVEVDGLGSTRSVGVSGSYLTLLRANIHGVGDGVRVGSNSRYEGNFIHDLAIGGGSHNDGMQLTGPTSKVTIRGNTIIHVRRQTSAIIVKSDLGPISDILIEGNWLNGGTYTVYAYSTKKYATQDVTLRANRFGRDHVYGPVATENPRRLRWEGNVWEDSQEAVPPPRSVEAGEPAQGSSPFGTQLSLLRGLLEALVWLTKAL
ncbi:MAG: hypothetical protein ABR592_11045 [Nitriliruptorales bacterium]